MNGRQLFLLTAAVGLTPIALSYGAAPARSLDYLFQIQVTDTNTTHIFRAVMGLYLALVAFWTTAAFKIELRQAALYSLVVFMLGLAAGRILSLIVDGIPSALLWVYLLLELGFGAVGIKMLRRREG